MRDSHSRSAKRMASDLQLGGSPDLGTTARAIAAPAGLGRLRRLQLWFYLGVPVLLGFLLGWLRVGRAADWPREVALAYWIGVALLSTGLLALATGALAPLLRRLRAPLWLTLLAGQLAGGFLLVDPALAAWRALLRSTLLPGLAENAVGGFGELLQRLPSNALMWIGLNLLFFRVLEMPRFGYHPSAARPEHVPPAQPASTATATAGTVPTTAVVSEAGPPSFMDRVRQERRGRLLALEADGHYLHVHTDAGSELVLYRLSDAIRELGSQAGAQVHRSWWVAADAVSAERRRDSLKLRNGLEVPVSRSYRLAARERGWLSGAGEV